MLLAQGLKYSGYRYNLHSQLDYIIIHFIFILKNKGDFLLWQEKRKKHQIAKTIFMK